MKAVLPFIKILVFDGRKKPEFREKFSPSSGNPHASPNSEIEPGTQWWQASAITSPLSLLPVIWTRRELTRKFKSKRTPSENQAIAFSFSNVIIIIIIIITLFKSQGYLGEHDCFTNWGEYKLTEIRANQIKCWFLRRGENRSTLGKTSRSRVENQQTQPTYGVESGNRSRATLVEGECSHHCARLALP